MVNKDDIQQSKSIQQETGRTFHLATRLLPERVRYPTYVLYAFFRIADDVVDQVDAPSPGAQRDRLEEIRAGALGETDPDDPVLTAFDDLRKAHDLSIADINTFIDAMLMDVNNDRFDRYADLEEYMAGSAVAVGNLMVDVIDPDKKETARPHARALAEAFQLTNFIRDVREDIRDYGRVYLPLETLSTYGISVSDLEAGAVTPAYRAAIRHELARTESLYREGVAGIRYLPEDCQFAVLLSATLYAEHHRRIRARNYDTLTVTPSLTRRRRLWVLAKTWWHWRRTGDPEATFYAVSPVSQTPSERPREATFTEPDRVV
jgi:phytoene synthase